MSTSRRNEPPYSPRPPELQARRFLRPCRKSHSIHSSRPFRLESRRAARIAASRHRLIWVRDRFGDSGKTWSRYRFYIAARIARALRADPVGRDEDPLSVQAATGSRAAGGRASCPRHAAIAPPQLISGGVSFREERCCPAPDSAPVPDRRRSIARRCASAGQCALCACRPCAAAQAVEKQPDEGTRMSDRTGWRWVNRRSGAPARGR